MELILDHLQKPIDKAFLNPLVRVGIKYEILGIISGPLIVLMAVGPCMLHCLCCINSPYLARRALSRSLRPHYTRVCE